MQEISTRFEPHSHTYYSSLRLIDAINSPEQLIDRAIELGLSGIAITDHECLSAHVRANEYAIKMREKYPNFKVALGNEIYLCGDRRKNQPYYHFILIAKNLQGHIALRELSSMAWLNSYEDRRMERVVTTYDDLKRICKKYPNSLIASTACLAGEVSHNTRLLIEAEKLGDDQGAAKAHDNIVNFILMCQELFGNDFYIECAPGCSKEQIIVNRRLVSISSCFGIPMIVGTDAHFLGPAQRTIHKAYLNSKEGEREVDAFYQYAYLQSNEEIVNHLAQSDYDKLYVQKMFQNSNEIYSKIENYSIFSHPEIPTVAIKEYPKREPIVEKEKYPILNSMFKSDDKVERYWINQCFEGFKEKKIDWTQQENEVYLVRLEEEAVTKRIIGEKIHTNMFSYPVTLQHYIDMIWECGSPVGAGRGSAGAGLNHWLLGITQVNPLAWDFPWFRYMNKDRLEIADVDLDLASSRRPLVLKKIREERRAYLDDSLEEIFKENLGCTLVSTFRTESAKSAILVACRGYRSEEWPEGIDVDIGQYLSSLIPIERGEVWSLEDVVYGNEEKQRKSIAPFIKEVEQFPGLMDIAFGIQKIISGRGEHASGVIFFEGNPFEKCAFMKAPNGDIITQWDLHQTEKMGNIKYDFLVTQVQDKILQTIKMLQQDNQIEQNLPLRELYNKYLHPDILPLQDKEVWKHIQHGDVLDLFQLDSDVGRQAAKKIAPDGIFELSLANGLMRLAASEKGAETPMEKYLRFKKEPGLWYDEMRRYGLIRDEVEAVRPYFEPSCGVPIDQECLMKMLMDSKICNFTLAEANTARKIVSKKQTKRVNELRVQVQTRAKSANLGRYIWDCGIKPQASYSFSIIHSTLYSFIGFQTAYLATHWNPIYWNTACLIINSNSEENEWDEEDDEESAVKKAKSANYEKIARAIGVLTSRGIKVSTIDINNSGYTFKPDAKNNRILYGLKPVTQVNEEQIDQIIAGRPYVSFFDFMNRCPLKKPTMLSLIKGGAFDNLEREWAMELGVDPRILIMTIFCARACEPKKRLTLQNFNGLINQDLIPNDMVQYKYAFNFNKYLKAKRKVRDYYAFDDDCYNFYEQYFDIDKIEIIAGTPCIKVSVWAKLYDKFMDGARAWLKEYQEEVLQELNIKLFLNYWDNYAEGSISFWEMSALCFYSHPHELANVDFNRYGIENFFSMPQQPEVDHYYKRNGRRLPIYKIKRIAGTVIGKNDTKASIALLTVDGVVNVKFTKEYYAMFKKQISEKDEAGDKHVKEKSWFKRGTKLMIQGYRKDDTFVSKTYFDTPGHQLYKITKVNKDSLILTSERYKTEEEYV